MIQLQDKPKIDILMATYNGEKYLEEQIFSILNQSYQNFRLLISDDHSKDQTRTILSHLSKQYPDKIFLIESKKNLGTKGNFSHLMQHAKAEYVMFSDQDDIWMKDKIAKSLLKMIKMEEDYGKNSCLLVHTDLTVVDHTCKILGESFWKYSNLTPHSFHTMNRFLIQNVVTGCTMMMNQALLNLSYPVPKESLMHDWWIALVASGFGKIGLVDETTIFYRQHEKNTLGAKKFKTISFLKEGFKKLVAKDKTFLEQAKARDAQAKMFLMRYHSKLGSSGKLMIKDYLALQNSNPLKKRYLVIKHKFYRSGFLRNFVTLTFKL